MFHGYFALRAINEVSDLVHIQKLLLQVGPGRADVNAVLDFVCKIHCCLLHIFNL